jgi:outer membrane protein assembly factor BamB
MRDVSAALLLMALACPATAQDWPNWRGPSHDGISAEKGFETRWESTPPKLWEQPLGSAFSGLSCVGGKVYTCGTASKQQILFCLNADTGEILWRTPIEEEYKEGQGGDGTRATPTVSDGRVYILGAQGRLLCCEAETGKEVWSRQFHAPPQWGYAGSVLIEGPLAIATAGKDDGALMALDKRTGEVVWKCGDRVVGYATPYPFSLDGRRYIAGLMAKDVLIAEADTGQELWTMPWKTEWDVNAATPVFHDGRLFISSGYNHGSILLKLRRDGDQLKADQVKGWEDKSIRAKFQTPVLYEGHLYVSDEVDLKCVEFATGKVKWKQRGIQHGTAVMADGHLVILTETGELMIAKATPQGFEPLTKVELLKGRCWTAPTLYKGRLYVRNREVAACYKLTRD